MVKCADAELTIFQKKKVDCFTAYRYYYYITRFSRYEGELTFVISAHGGGISQTGVLYEKQI